MISTFIHRVIKLAEKFKLFKKIYTIDYEGKGVSLNQFYDGRHWTHRDKLKKKFIPLFRGLLEKEMKDDRMHEFGIIMLYNSRHDTDNIVGIEKLFVDSLRDTADFEGWVNDDSKNYYKFMMVIPDNTLVHNTYKFLVVKIK